MMRARANTEPVQRMEADRPPWHTPRGVCRGARCPATRKLKLSDSSTRRKNKMSSKSRHSLTFSKPHPIESPFRDHAVSCQYKSNLFNTKKDGDKCVPAKASRCRGLCQRIVSALPRAWMAGLARHQHFGRRRSPSRPLHTRTPVYLHFAVDRVSRFCTSPL